MYYIDYIRKKNKGSPTSSMTLKVSGYVE